MIIGYIHNLSGLKTSKSTNFDMQLQTKDKMFRAVCFSAEKHNQFKARWESIISSEVDKVLVKAAFVVK